MGVNSQELQGKEAGQLASLAKDEAVDKGIRKKGRKPQLLVVTSVKCEGLVSLEGRICKSLEQTNNH